MDETAWSIWVDTLALVVGLLGILWAGMRVSKITAPPMVLIGLIVWLVAMGIAERCGARLEQWVSPADAEADLLRSALLVFEN